MIGQHKAKALAAKAAAQEAEAQMTPTETVTAPPADYAQALLMIAELLKQARETDNADIKARTAVDAERLLLERERAMREMPENKQPPLISVFNPLGDRDHPRPELRCKTLWCGTEVKGDVETVEELTLLNQLVPGDFRVTKGNGEQIAFKVEARKDSAGKLEQVSVSFPCKGEHKTDHMSMAAYCRQALGETVQPVSELLSEVAALKAEVERMRAGAAA